MDLIWKKSKYFLSILFFVLISLQGITQNRTAALSFHDMALNFYHQKETKSQVINAVKAISKDSTFAEPYILLGNIYQDKKEYTSAIGVYRKGFALDSINFPNVLLTIAELELETKRFDSAVKHASRFLEIEKPASTISQKAKLIVSSAEFRKQAFLHPINIQKQKLKYDLELTDEYVNGISLDGQKLLFTQKKEIETNADGQKSYTEEIIEASLVEDSLCNSKVFELPLEMQKRVGAASLSIDGRYLFFTSCHQPQSGSNCDLFCMSLLSEDKNVFNLGRNINSKEWESQPCFSADGKTMFFASKREGGYGGSDIWFSTLNEEGSFSRPQNAGAAINTAEDEMAPFIHADTRTLYFSSKGHPGMGGFDLFVSRMNEEGTWMKAENLGYPLNTSADEINMIIAPDGVNAFLSAKETNFDLYHFTLGKNNPAQVTYITGIISDSKSLSPLFARVELFDLNSGKPYAVAQSLAGNGHFIIPLPINQAFAFHVNKEGYLFYSGNFEVRAFENEIDTLRIALHPIRLNEKVSLNNIFFETDQFDLLPKSKLELDLLKSFLDNNPKLTIEIGGHTDNVGTPEYNQTLSENRAKTVYDYLINKGIDLDRLGYKGFGEMESLSSNDTEEGRAANRRTEFKIVGIN